MKLNKFVLLFSTLLISGIFQYIDFQKRNQLFFVVNMSSSLPSTGQVYFNVGSGFNERDSEKVNVNQGKLERFFFKIPNGTIKAIRFDYTNVSSINKIEYAQIENQKGEVIKKFDFKDFKPLQQIDKIEITNHEFIIYSVKNASDPILILENSQFENPFLLEKFFIKQGLSIIGFGLLGFIILIGLNYFIFQAKYYKRFRNFFQNFRSKLDIHWITKNKIEYTLLFVSIISFSILDLNNPTTVNIEIVSGTPDVFQLYYDTGMGYNGNESITERYRASGSQIISFSIPGRKFFKFRIDPGSKAGFFKLKKISLLNNGKEKSWAGKEMAVYFRPLNYIKQFEVVDDLLVIETTGKDPHFEYTGNLYYDIDVTKRWGLIFIISLILLLCIFYNERRFEITDVLKIKTSLLDKFYLILIITIYTLIILIRVVSIFGIYPGNAPDEYGHLGIIKSLADGKILSLKEELSLDGYPYAIYNPLPYLPSVIAMWIHSLFSENYLHGVSNYFSFMMDYSARIGNSFYAAVYIYLLHILTKTRPRSEQILILVVLGFLPQIYFVQSYANLDSMGITLTLYMYWAVLKQKWKHVAFAVFLTVCAKMNYFCLFLLPAVQILFIYRTNYWMIIKKGLLVGVLPIAIGSLWFVYNYFVNTLEYGGSFLGYSALMQIYPNAVPAGDRVFSEDFITVSLSSAFAIFGWMNQMLPYSIVYDIWIYGLLPLASLSVFISYFQKRHSLELSVISVVFANIFLHFYASYTGDYQRQGRYLFPGIILLVLYLPYVFSYKAVKESLLSKFIYIAIIVYMVSVSSLAFKEMIQYEESTFGLRNLYNGEKQFEFWNPIRDYLK